MNCLTCGYDLQQLEDNRCPECGRVFDAGDLASFGKANTHRLLRWATWSGWTAALVAAGVGVGSAASMASGKHDIVVLIFFWMFAMLPVTLACMAYLSLRSACKKWPSMRAFITALLLFAFNASLLTQWPIHASFLLHRAALNRHAQHAAQHPHLHTGTTRIGLFTVLETSTRTVQGTNQVVLKINGGSGPDYLIYGMTDAEVQNVLFNTWSYQRLDDNWHIVHED